MNNSLIHRCATGLAVSMVVLILTGALITSSEGLPDASPLLQAPDWAASLHRVLAALVGLLAAGLCAWLLLKAEDAGQRIVAGATLVVCVAAAATGPVALFHAFLAQLLMAGTVLLAILTSPAWISTPGSPKETPGSSFRWLSWLIAAFVLLQVLLGDAYRHRAMGVILHILNAMIVALVIFISGMVLTRKSSEPTLVRRAAVALMIVTGIQVMLGFAAFILMLMLKTTHMAVVVVSVAHVATGALTLAASLVFAIVVRREGVSTAGGRLEPNPSQAHS